MSDLKRISREAIPAALERARHYRLLNEPLHAESICLDILEVDPENQAALVTLILARSDQFSSRIPAELRAARDLLPRLNDPYERAYYAGILAERRAAALVEQGGARRGQVAYELLCDAMDWYEKAHSLAPLGNDDSILRFNTCVRIMQKNPHVAPPSDDPSELMLE